MHNDNVLLFYFIIVEEIIVTRYIGRETKEVSDYLQNNNTKK